jgi:hypothetical protein
MTYDLNDVVRFTNEIVKAFERKKNKGHDVSVQAKSDWAQHLSALDAAYTDTSEHCQSKHKLARYAMLLENAVCFLSVKEEQGKALTAAEIQSVKTHMAKIIEVLPHTFPNIKIPDVFAEHIKAPSIDRSVLFEPAAREKKTHKKFKEKVKEALGGVGCATHEVVEEVRATILDKRPEVLQFLNSEQFEALKKYQAEVLTDDKRSHQYLCYFNLSERRKANVLNDLLTQLESQNTMEGIKKVLTNFYEGKNQQMRHKDSAEFDKSPYEILNLGQNITTRFFNRFGMRSTTITLLDALAATVGLGNRAEPAKATSKMEW